MNRRDFVKVAAVTAVAPLAVVNAAPAPKFIGKLVFVDPKLNLVHAMDCYDDSTVVLSVVPLDTHVKELGQPRAIFTEHLNL